MSKKGKIYTYSIIYAAAEDFKDHTPYVAAVVEVEGKKALTLLEGYIKDQPVEIGMEVEFSRLDNNGKALYKFIR